MDERGAGSALLAEEHEPNPWGRGVASVRSRAPWLFRRAWVLIVCVVLVLAVTYMVSSKRTVKYSANSILSVITGASSTSPGSAQEAANLAATYAGLIPADDAIVANVAAKTGLSFSQVQSDLAVTVQNGTSLLVVTFTSPVPSTALVGANATAHAISGDHPVSPAIPGGTMVVTKQAVDTTRHSTSGTIVLALGGIFGILLGLILALAWERADPRFDRPAQVTEVLGVPTRLASELSDASAVAIMRQWQAEAGTESIRVAFLAGVSNIQGPIGAVARRFASSANSWGTQATVRQPMPTEVGRRRSDAERQGGQRRSPRAKPSTAPNRAPAPTIQFIVGGTPGAEGGEVVAQQADLTVLAITPESKVREVQRSVEILEELGVTPSWALLIDSRVAHHSRLMGPRPRRSGAERDAGSGEPPVGSSVADGSSAGDLNLVD